MRILHISTSDNSGAGLCCLRIHKSMLENGIESKMVVLVKTRDDVQEVYRYGSMKDTIYRYFSKALRSLGFAITLRNKLFRLSKINHTTYTMPISYIDLSKCELLVWADIIHLHWVNWFLDYPSFFTNVKKPVVWTLHDENLFYGIAHHHKSILAENKYEIRFCSLKRRAITNAINLNIVFLSQMMQNVFGKNPLVKDRRQTVINNSVDGSIFFPLDKASMREKYNLEEGRTIVAFVANDICDPNKGLDVLSEVITEIGKCNIQILAIGRNTQGKIWPNVKQVGSIGDVKILREYLSAADYFALPSYQEAFSQSPLEAMACGLPVIAFPVSGTTELIEEDNGVICDGFSKKDLVVGLNILLGRQYNGEHIRQGVLNSFSPKVIALKYIDYYNTVIECNE